MGISSVAELGSEAPSHDALEALWSEWPSPLYLSRVRSILALSETFNIQTQRSAAMPLKDQIKNYAKKLVEDRPDETALRKMIRGKKPISLRFEDNGIVPNNPKHPVLVYRGAVTLGGAFDPATIIDTLFETNGWGRSWRDGVYDFVHYHSQIHEVMGVARGNATIECGGIKGRMVNVKAGDVVVLPAGTGHRVIEASGNFLVVGAYPEEGVYDECTDMRERPEARKRIAKVRQPKKDPVYGSDGPLVRQWRRKRT
jgi:uncharacterized protein YjlB